MRRYRVTKGIVSGTIELNPAAAQDYRDKGYKVQDIGPSLMIIVDEDTGIPLDWQHVGYAAYMRNEPRVPALDRHVTDALGLLNLKVGTGAAAIFTAWLAGYDAAHLAA